MHIAIVIAIASYISALLCNMYYFVKCMHTTVLAIVSYVVDII